MFLSASAIDIACISDRHFCNESALIGYSRFLAVADQQRILIGLCAEQSTTSLHVGTIISLAKLSKVGDA